MPASSSVHMYTFIHYTYVQVAIIRPLCIPYIAIVNIVHMYTFIHYTYVKVAIIRPVCIPYMAIVNIVLYMKALALAMPAWVSRNYI